MTTLQAVRSGRLLLGPRLCLAAACALGMSGGVRADQAADLTALQSRIDDLCSEGKFDEATELTRRFTARAESLYRNRPVDLAVSLNNLALIVADHGRTADAKALLERAVKSYERGLGQHDPEVGTALDNLGGVYSDEGDYRRAEDLCRRALQIRERALGPEHEDVGTSLQNLGHVLYMQSRYDEAETIYKRAATIFSRSKSTLTDLAAVQCNLADVLDELGRFDEAESLYLQAIKIEEVALGPNSPELASTLEGLGALYNRLARHRDAEALYRRCLAIYKEEFAEIHPQVARTLNNLAGVYADEGRFADAEVLYRRALDVSRRASGEDHPSTASVLNNLSQLMSSQGRHADAVAPARKAAEVYRNVFGATSNETLLALNNLACLHVESGQLDEALTMFRQMLDEREKQLPPGHPDIALTMNNIAFIYGRQGKFDDAERLYRRVLDMETKSFGAGHPRTLGTLTSLAVSYCEQGRWEDAARCASAAVERQAGAAPQERFQRQFALAVAERGRGRVSQAFSALAAALDAAEQARSFASGADHERAGYFTEFSYAYEKMIRWRAEEGDAAAAFEAVERSRARVLMDQIAAAGVDPLAGLPESEAEKLRGAEAAARLRVAALESRLDAAATDTAGAAADRLRTEIAAARRDWIAAHVAVRNAGPAYRQMVGRDFRPLPAAQLRRELVGDDQLMLIYYLGSDASYVLTIPPGDVAPETADLIATDSQAAILGIEAGRLTLDGLQSALQSPEKKGVLQLLRSPEGGIEATDKLATLWEILVPPEAKRRLLSGEVRRLIVIPDGPLAALPFETLVVEAGMEPKYLLDVGPPVLAAPSATLLINLRDRPAAAKRRVLSVGDPAYAIDIDAGSDEGVTARSRYGAMRGAFGRLPYSGLESSWVTDAFRERGWSTGTLRGADARELSVRSYASDYGILHFACHGVVDGRHGNLFGALALAPGPNPADDPDDDGFLTLGEIYELNLKGTELSILSACDTNFGPDQQGEGVWSLSRGFLVAGSRRVVAGNWLVDDEAAASLIGSYCGLLAGSLDTGAADYASSLHEAKRRVRSQSKWRSPFFWGTFVLLGPP